MELALTIATLLGGTTALWFYWDRFREKSTARTPDGLTYRTSSALVKIKIPEELAKENLAIGLLHIRDGMDHIPDHGPLLNNEVESVLVEGTLIFNVEFNGHLGFQFKCYIDFKSTKYSHVKSLLEGAGYLSVSEGHGKTGRAWFILPDYAVCSTIDGFTNNFYFPA